MVAECVWAGTQQHVRSFTLPKRRESWSVYMTLGHACLRDTYARQLNKCDGLFSDFDSFIDRLSDLWLAIASLTAPCCMVHNNIGLCCLSCNEAIKGSVKGNGPSQRYLQRLNT